MLSLLRARGSIPGRGTQIPPTAERGQKTKKKKEKKERRKASLQCLRPRGTCSGVWNCPSSALEEAAPGRAGPPDCGAPRQTELPVTRFLKKEKKKGSQRKKTLPLGSKISPGSLGFETHSSWRPGSREVGYGGWSCDGGNRPPPLETCNYSWAPGQTGLCS